MNPVKYEQATVIIKSHKNLKALNFIHNTYLLYIISLSAP